MMMNWYLDENYEWREREVLFRSGDFMLVRDVETDCIEWQELVRSEECVRISS